MENINRAIEIRIGPYCKKDKDSLIYGLERHIEYNMTFNSWNLIGKMRNNIKDKVFYNIKIPIKNNITNEKYK